MGHQRALLAVHGGVEQDVAADFVIVPHVAGGELEIPVHLAIIGIVGNGAVGEEVVAGAIGGVEHGHRIARAPDGLIRGDIIGACHPHGAAARFPGVVLVFPGLAARLARRRDDVAPPDLLARGRVQTGDPVAHAAIAASGANEDLVLDGQGRGGDLQVRLIVEIGLPDHLARVLVGGDDARRAIGDRDHQIAPQSGATVGQGQLLLAGIHAPEDAPGFAGAHVDLVDDAPLVNQIHVAIFDQRGRLQVLVGRGAADGHRIGELQALHVLLVDLLKWREPLPIIGAMIHKPVAGLRIGQPLGRHLGGESGGREHRGGEGACRQQGGA